MNLIQRFTGGALRRLRVAGCGTVFYHNFRHVFIRVVLDHNVVNSRVNRIWQPKIYRRFRLQRRHNALESAHTHPRNTNAQCDRVVCARYGKCEIVVGVNAGCSGTMEKGCVFH